jgi:RNA polymerase sigma factor (sigma-70 family)
MGSKWDFRCGVEVVLNTVGEILQSVHGKIGVSWLPCQIRFCAVFRFGGCYNLKMTPDSELLRRFAQTNSEDAFAELVKRHVNLVYSAALRQMNGDEHLAKDVAQTVFADLARKATSLSHRENLTGWLYTSAHFAAAKIVRGENRRRDREEKFMREPIHENAPEADWEKLRPTLDDAMHELKETDREAILLRYFEDRQFAEVGPKLGLNENAARMRVERALEKLRDIFAKRGITTVTAFASVISANAIQIAPANLAATLTTTSIAAAGTGTFTLLKIMTATKLKLGISALVVAGAATALVVQYQAQEKLRAENESLTQQIAQLQNDNESLSNRLAAANGSKSFSDEQFNELLKLRGEVGVLRHQVDEIGKLREENRRISKELADANQTIQSLPSPEQALFNKKRIQAVNDAKMVGLAMRIWAGDNNDQYPTNFDDMTNELGGITNEIHFKETFEFVNAGAANEHYPQMLMLREITPRQAPDGKWERVYGLADGSVWTETSTDGNFDAYEKQQQQYNPLPNQ